VSVARRIGVAMLVASLVTVTACGSAVSKCDGIADRAIGRFAEVLAELDAATEPADVGAYFAELAAFTDEARAAGCDFDELNDRVRDAAASMHPTSTDGAFVLGQVQVRGLFSE
jgi:hypothetical protein